MTAGHGPWPFTQTGAAAMRAHLRTCAGCRSDAAKRREEIRRTCEEVERSIALGRCTDALVAAAPPPGPVVAVHAIGLRYEPGTPDRWEG